MNRGIPSLARLRPRHPWLGAAGHSLALSVLSPLFASRGLFRGGSGFARERLRAVSEKLARGEIVRLAGIGAAGHNTGVALIEVSKDNGIRILANNEEERFSGEKHSTRFPALAIQALLEQHKDIAAQPDRIDAWLGTWDYPALSATLLRMILEELPASAGMLRPNAFPFMNAGYLFQASRAPGDLAAVMGQRRPIPIIALPHHENHAWFSWSVSPFAKEEAPVIVSVLDGAGDRGAISIYLVHDGTMRLLFGNDSVFDSLGLYYGFISATQGGWTILSSEGRYMGAAAYGDSDRLTNPFYAQLRQIFSLGPGGSVALNRSLANWQRRLFDEPYTADLIRILGQPVALKDMWNPDAVLKVENIDEREGTRDRLDKAAAAQLVFEDVLFHIIGAAIRMTGASRLVLTGGAALNAIANTRLLEHFDEAYYQRHHGVAARLHLWAPPTPGDAGVTLGVAFTFAHLAGAPPGPALDHAFYCGSGPRRDEIGAALVGATDLAWVRLGDAASPQGRAAIADLMAFVTARNGVIAIVQGAAETGPRALGHRSILANACNAETRETLNARVKYREAIRPLAPMMTLEAAMRWFDLSPGASDADYNAYNYMVLTARARPGAAELMPAVIHKDGTARLQIVRAESDPLCHAYLKAVGRRLGVEAAVNTSFNVAGPIVQTAAQAVATLLRSKGLDALLLFAEEGEVYAVWRSGLGATAASRFPDWFASWRQESGVDFCPA